MTAAARGTGRLGPALLALVAACGVGRHSWVLVTPPEVPDAAFPRGQRLLPDAPLPQWQTHGSFPSAHACDAAKKANVDRTIDQARAEHGAAAKYELPVRRAVNARCVLAGSAAAKP